MATICPDFIHTGRILPRPVLALDRYSPAQGEALLRQSLDQRRDGGRPLVCSACRTAITTGSQRVARGGSHEHQFRNPHEQLFRIGCFASAPGCVSQGAATEQWTWFPGYAWQVALCGGCGMHLGWRYRDTGADMFYGLIVARLMPAPD